MSSPVLDKFGGLITQEMRDKALDFFEDAVQDKLRAPSLRGFQDELASLSDQQLALVRRAVMLSLDHGIHDFLFALVKSHDSEQGIEVRVDGLNIVELSDGLHGEPWTREGWIARLGRYPESNE
ncbi:MAG: hypothetical protein ACIAXF_07845 [Phycisphaerales bacterium JB063]